jgi:CheY-like chemotaxis protein
MPERPVVLPLDAFGSRAMTDGRSSPAKRRGPRSVLIIEDEFLIAVLIDDMVREFGYAVSGMATTIAAARQELAKHNFDIVLLDMGIDGPRSPEIADILLETGIPFAFVTGYDDPSEAGHADIPLLRKPFTADQLRALLQKLRGTDRRRDRRFGTS